MKRKSIVLSVLAFALLVVSCVKPDTKSSQGSAANTSGRIAQPGQVMAFVITNPADNMWGLNSDTARGEGEKTALGQIGDLKMINNVAAFIIQGMFNQHTTGGSGMSDSYFPFAGNLMDAVAMVNGRQAGPEQFQELQMLVGNLDVGALTKSFLRALQPDSVVVLDDGSHGAPAVVRVHGTEVLFHTVELNLMAFLASWGMTYVTPPPFNFDITLDYILRPDSRVLEMQMTVRNTEATEHDIMDGMAMFFSDTTPVKLPYMTSVQIQGFGLQIGLPWMVASRGDGAWGIGMPGGSMAGLNISGLSAAIDGNMVSAIGGAPVHLAAAGQPGDSHTFMRFFSVGATGFNSAIEGLDIVNPLPLPLVPISTQPLAGRVFDLLSGADVPGAEVDVEIMNPHGDWVFWTGFNTDIFGNYSGIIPFSSSIPLQYRIVAGLPGRKSSEPLTFDPLTMPVVNIPMSPPGALYYEVRDQAGTPIPSKILLWQDCIIGPACPLGKEIKQYIFTPTGLGAASAIPGIYTVTVTRGFEYTTYQGSITIPNGGSYNLNVVLNHAVDTTGYLSVDGHIHSGRSPDNWISVEERVRTCSAEGLEVSVATDHDFIGSWQWAVDLHRLNAWQVNVAGDEITPPLMGHLNMYPVVPRFDIDARGGYLKWFEKGNPTCISNCASLDESQIFARARAMGAGIVALNHSRSGVTSTVNWDPTTGVPLITDPTKFGMDPAATVWDWGFDTLELMNGSQNPFKDHSTPLKAINSGTFEDWLSFLNMGHLKTAVGVSDAHNYEMPGNSRTFYRSPTDSTLAFNANDLVAAMKQGRAVVSDGAFARVRVDGTADIGDLITDTGAFVNLWVHIEAIPEIDVSYFKVFVNCDQVVINGHGYIPTQNPGGVVKYDGTLQIPISQDSNIVVVGFTGGISTAVQLPLGLYQIDPAILDKVPRFATNAIYVDHDGNGAYDPPNAKACFYGIPDSGG